MTSIFHKSLSFLSIVFIIAPAWANAAPGYVLAKGVPSAESGVVEAAPKFQPLPALFQAATPAVSVSGPGDVLIGEDFTFTVSLKNSGSTPGYGPFVDLVLPTNGADGNFGRDVPDGVEFISAATLGFKFNAAQNTLVVQNFPIGTGDTITCLDHPWARQSNGDYVQVCGPAGDTLVSLRLPFGGVAPGQPLPTIEVAAHLSKLADLDTPLNIRARGGFLYGNDSLDNWCCGDLPIIIPSSPNSASWPPTPIIPKVFTFEKS